MNSIIFRSRFCRIVCTTLLGQLLLAAVCVVHADESNPIRLCQDSEDVYPWTLKSRPGLNNVLLKIVELKTGQSFEIESAPLQRCEKEMLLGDIDGIFAISFLPERQINGVYPMRGNVPDVSKRLMNDGYSLFRRRGDNTVSWNGKTLLMDGMVGAQRGYSINSQLKGFNVEVDSGSYSAEVNLRKLIASRLNAVALRTDEGKSVLATNREFSGKVEILPIPLVEKPYYLIFSKQFTDKHEKLTSDIWDMIEQVRESPEYRVIEVNFR